MTDKIIKIAVIGDVHDLWNEFDHEALEFLQVDLVLFVGDFGNESIPLISRIAQLNIPKAIILGNHDAWFSATEWGRKKCPYDRTLEDRVQQQLDILGKSHVGYSYLDFPELDISVVGSRPFSWGGSKWKCEEFYREKYAIENFHQSSDKIIASVNKTQAQQIIFVGHNGPFGLGANPEDTCGRDWKPLGGDFGDPDFQEAIKYTQELGKNVPLVTFGHMHHSLRHTKDRLRTIINQDEHKTIYLNAASTPRIQEIEGQKIHKFSLVTLDARIVTKIDLIGISEKMKIKEAINLYGK
ncbi:TIGR04168 family protein [Cyanobacterium aponinum AL20118]|uniref:TIGR04168 family protein n=2 Tax=Cyanobacterium aponinum TaxID=379064 RepID=A0A844GNX8_9CHRO|nr:TIGR04168 family protein [Cyanobacterium aponinum]MTF38294.1 TIGR04168 family protein [Cyanobacterium aponinum 0216]PHV64024.1 TIGR04168 family protein [Cyanobacterium aponinum IPPAS B-1201]WPF87864.1 TIGR04168 family protein [Cyanobacterium aponinum AL20115]